MTVEKDAASPVKLCPIFGHRAVDTAANPPDRYLFSRERTLTNPPGAAVEYAGRTWLAFYTPDSEIEGALPVGVERRKLSGGRTLYKLSSLGPQKTVGYDRVMPESGFWALATDASSSYPSSSVWEHGVAENDPSYPRFYYDLQQKGEYGWTDGVRPIFQAVSPEDYFEIAAKRFFDEHNCPQMALDATGVPGMAIAVVTRAGVLRLKGYGVGDLVKKRPVDEYTIFQLASVSKPITSTIIAKLVGEEVLAWGDLVSKWDPTFLLRTPGSTEPPDPKRQTVTIADLLAHCSGLPAHAGDLLEDIGNDREAILGKLGLLPVLPRKTREQYTNFGFTAAAVAAMASTKSQTQSWAELAKEQLYFPLNMMRTTSRFEDFDGDHNCAVGHQRFERYPGQFEWVAPTTPRNPDAQAPAGGVRSCAADLATWMRVQLNWGNHGGKPFISRDALEYTHTPYIKGSGGLGWNVSPLGDISHSGAFEKGAATCVRISPALGVGIAVITNGEPIGLPEAVCSAFFDYLLCNDLPDGQTMSSWLAKTETLMSALIPIPKDHGYGIWKSAPPRDLTAYCGTYEHAYYGTLVVAPRGGKPDNYRPLTLTLGSHPPVDLHPWDGDTFTFQTFGENAVGLSALELDFSMPGEVRACVKYLQFSETDPTYSEIDPEAGHSAWFSRKVPVDG